MFNKNLIKILLVSKKIIELKLNLLIKQFLILNSINKSLIIPIYCQKKIFLNKLKMIELLMIIHLMKIIKVHGQYIKVKKIKQEWKKIKLN